MLGHVQACQLLLLCRAVQGQGKQCVRGWLAHAASQYSARLFNPPPKGTALLACFRSYSPVTRRLMNRLVTHRQPRVKVMNQAMSKTHTWGSNT